MNWVITLKFLSIFGSLFLFLYLTSKEKIILNYKIELFLACLIVGFLGSKFVSIIENYVVYGFIGNSGAYSKHGARLSGAFFFAYLIYFNFRRYKQNPIFETISYILTISAIFGAIVIGKWSCFILKECCFGTPTDSILGIQINTMQFAFSRVHPVPIYDSLSSLLIILGSYFVLKKRIQVNFLTDLTLLILFLYLLSVEFIRDNPKFYIGLSINQVIYSTLIIIIAARHVISYFMKSSK
jgi:hypothetical protein